MFCSVFCWDFTGIMVFIYQTMMSQVVPSGKRVHNELERSTMLMGKLTISTGSFSSSQIVSLPEGNRSDSSEFSMVHGNPPGRFVGRGASGGFSMSLKLEYKPLIYTMCPPQL